ncbi:hypothetical protein E4U42_002346 [Claviceps africana]|uniref:Uncharacterized protein n=1 Tax=Claviceps africana TaxID=83212 RepID=A0A8K0J8B5_9HYPO|nr:hypothetical protein E4U42_002346 [Claviceps africana]
MSARAVFFALRSLGCQRGLPPSRLVSGWRRGFSSTASNAVRAVFTKTNNAELNMVLQYIQEKIIFPAYLPKEQRKIVFDSKKKSFLEQNPIVIEVDGLEHKFSHIDRSKDIMNSKRALSNALNSMHSADDWANLGTLLAGLKKAGIRLKARHWGEVVRKAGRRGHVYTVIECAKQSDKTGLSLKGAEVTIRVLAFVNDKICSSSGAAAESRQALTWVETVLDLLQRPEHATPDEPTRNRLHYSRLVRGMVLFARASVANAGTATAAEKDVDSLRDEVALLTSLWNDAVENDLEEVAEFVRLKPALEREANEKQGGNQADEAPKKQGGNQADEAPKTQGGNQADEAPKKQGGNRADEALNGSAYVQVLAQNIKGIKIAQQVLGQEAEALSPILKNLESHLQDFAIKSKLRKESWANEYEKVMGQKPDWPAVGNKTVEDA